MRAQLDVYSGRPNPIWDLTTEEAAQFLQLLRSLPAATRGTIWNGLGYRGISVSKPGGTIDGCDTVVVSRGIVVCHGPGGEQTLLDQGRAMERWLFQTSRAHIDSALYTAISAELTR